jgi:predicted PurR-regulated permease PerM
MLVISFLLGIFITLGFFLMASMATIFSVAQSGWQNIVIAMLVLFMCKVTLLHTYIIEPAINGRNVKIHKRILMVLLGIWAILIPCLEAELFKTLISSSMEHISIMLLRLF